MYQPNDYVMQIANYIITNLKKGYSMDSLRFSLMDQGYSRISVEKAIEQANKIMALSAPAMKEKPRIIYKTEPDVSNFSYKKQGFWSKIKGWFS